MREFYRREPERDEPAQRAPYVWTDKVYGRGFIYAATERTSAEHEGCRPAPGVRSDRERREELTAALSAALARPPLVGRQVPTGSADS